MCGALRLADAGEKAVLMGWMNRRRDLGQIIFVDLRDRSGITQVVFNHEMNAAVHDKAQALRNEFVIAVIGTVKKRDADTINKNIPTGEVELVAEELRILNVSKPLPFLPSDTVLANLAKGHTRADLRTALRIVRDAGVAFRPTWVAFTPWTTLADYVDMLDFVQGEGLIDHVDPVQYTIRLLVPPGSALLESPTMIPHLGRLVREAFHYEWTHPDPRMDDLHRTIAATVERASGEEEDPGVTFYRVRRLAERAAGTERAGQPAALAPGRPRPARLTEPWFC